MQLDAITTEQASVGLGIAAGTIQLIGYFAYLKLTKKTGATSWFIWTIGALIDVISYASVTDHDWVKSVLPAVCAMACISTFLYLLMRGRFDRPEGKDLLFVALDLGVTVFWYKTGSAITANLLFQASTLLSFGPIISDQLKEKGPKNGEHPVPWLLWTTAYGLMFAAVWMRLDRWEELAYPAVHFVTHFAVLAIALVKLRPCR